MAEGYKHEAGGGNTLSVIRHGRDEFTLIEATNDSGSEILPGYALMLTEDANGNAAFDLHDGTAGTPVYVAVEARGRGMNADVAAGDGFADGDGLQAVRASGGGLNVKLATGETVALGDTIGVDAAAADGTFTSASADYNEVYGEVNEDLDLSGASSPELVETEVAN